MREPMMVRLASPQDVEAIAALYVELKGHHEELQPANPRYRVPNEEWMVVTRRYFAEPGSAFHVADRGGRLVGFARTSLTRSLGACRARSTP